MSKSSSIFVCQQCGNEFSKWQGKCNFCGEWNSLVETVNENRKLSKNNKVRSTSTSDLKPTKLLDIKLLKIDRLQTKISELDRVLGGGLVSGQVVLIAGEPGIGKSTLFCNRSMMLVIS
jgi:DNA repair protein RadA/Sms